MLCQSSHCRLPEHHIDILFICFSVFKKHLDGIGSKSLLLLLLSANQPPTSNLGSSTTLQSSLFQEDCYVSKSRLVGTLESQHVFLS
jgi:hypothetical protein